MFIENNQFVHESEGLKLGRTFYGKYYYYFHNDFISLQTLSVVLLLHLGEHDIIRSNDMFYEM